MIFTVADNIPLGPRALLQTVKKKRKKSNKEYN
jgi:hypothetical protein